MAVVVLGNTVGLAANVAAAVYAQRAAEAASTASALFAANNTQLANEYESLGFSDIELSNSIAAVQSFCEVAVLLLIVAAFIVTGVVCARIVNLNMLSVDRASAGAAAGRALRRRVVATTVVIFVTFIVRSVQSTMTAVARQLQDIGTTDGARTCSGVTNRCDPSCRNVFTHMHFWMINTPEFQATVVLISSPLTLLVALWGMTSRQMLQSMKPKEQEVPLRQL